MSRNWPVRLVFFSVWNKGVIRTGLLAGTVYSDYTGRYGTEFTPLFSTPHKSWAVGLIYSTSKGYVNQYWEKKYMWLYRKYTTHGQELYVSYSVAIACKCCIILDVSRIWLWKLHKNYMWESILSVPNVAMSWLSNNFY